MPGVSGLLKDRPSTSWLKRAHKLPSYDQNLFNSGTFKICSFKNIFLI
jgi:hypothetical protein